jgi:glycosyltransferase involved in cell wall biosynthesis
LVKTGKPLLWTLHDERAYTGGCHYTTDCDGYMYDCSQCKQLQFDPLRYPSKVLKRKYEILSKANFTVVATSQWQYDRVKQSTLFKDARVELITNSVDVEKYAPQDKNIIKQKYEIPQDVITLQFGAHNVNDIRKGYIYLQKALDICMENQEFKYLCDNNKILLLKLGKTDERDTPLPISTKEFGLIRDNDKLIELYNATDIFILPSLEDNLPYSMVESMSCGVPVIAFDTGGISDIIDHSLDLLAPVKDAQILANLILELVFDKEKREELSKTSRDIILSKCTFEKQADKYYKLYNELLKKV